MIISNILKLNLSKPRIPAIISAHTETCPTRHSGTGPICAGPIDSQGLESGSGKKRALKCSKCRLGFIPDEWFTFFHSKTGVTGPYVFGVVLVNYLLSKEIYVMEHEYYTSLSIAPMVYYATTRFGPQLGKMLDKEVDEISNAFEKSRKDEKSVYENIIKAAKDAQWRAKGQKELMECKKENVSIQLEAIYRERRMELYKVVKGRLDYQVKLFEATARIQQRWMIQWIIENVVRSITPDFQQAYLVKSIQDIAAIAGRNR